MQILLILIFWLTSFLIGSLPLISWLTYGLSKKDLKNLGTGNISVSAAFYHGGKVVGILAVLSEAAKGIGVVYLAKLIFPGQPVWEIIGLIALVLGRYFIGKGAGTTNVFWGMVSYDAIAAWLTLAISGLIFSFWRRKEVVRLIVLGLLVLIISLRHPSQVEVIVATLALVGLMAWIYQNIPDDLDLATVKAQKESQAMFSFLRGQSPWISLAQPLKPAQVGSKAANLSQLLQWGYAVPEGWVLSPDADPQALIAYLNPREQEPLIVRSSALEEDGLTSSAAGQYTSILHITSQQALAEAIAVCRAAYKARGKKGGVIVQKQIQGVYSGVAFSKDPIDPCSEAIVIEALPGEAVPVVSGTVTPEQYRVWLKQETIQIEGQGTIPPSVLEKVAKTAQAIEQLNHGLPQDLEWTYQGEQLWLLQARPITTLTPLWTRKIASEVIPGLIKPLTWSINRPLTCGVWGEIFTLVLGKEAAGLDFEETATLHLGRAYFNATLLGDIFRRMGLPPESLEFLTRGAKMSKPPWQSTSKNLPGLMRLLAREWHLERDFNQDSQQYFQPLLARLEESVSSSQIESILEGLKRATYYNILAPLSFALRQGIGKVKEEDLDYSDIPEVQSLRSLSDLAQKARGQIDNPAIEAEFDQFLSRYGYLSQVATDISVPRWQDDPTPVRELFRQLITNPVPVDPQKSFRGGRTLVQRRLTLKGRVTEVYCRLLAHLRARFLHLARQWSESHLLKTPEDIFYLSWSEIQHIEPEKMPAIIAERQKQWQAYQEIETIPYLVYGNYPLWESPQPISGKVLQGIGASPGVTEGVIKIVQDFRDIGEINEQTILVVPYTDAGWVPLVAKAGGLIAEVGGRLSHGAILAREAGIPAVMDIHHAAQLLHNGQRVRINGHRGIVEIVDEIN